MKSRITIDLSIFNSILKELKAVRRELRAMKGEPERKPIAQRDLKDAITTQEVLRVLKVTPATLNNYERKGLLKFHKEGRAKIYSQAEVAAFKKNKGRSKRLTSSVLTRKFKQAD